MTKLKGFRKEELARWSQQHLSAGSYVVSDGLYCFRAVEKSGCQHEAFVTGGGPACVAIEPFTWVNTMIRNVKNLCTALTMPSVTGTCRVTWPNFVTDLTGVLILRT
jgi:hypothetical protein